MYAQHFAADGESEQMRSTCDACTRSKIKCEGGLPCARCNRRKVECVYTEKRRCGPKRKKPPPDEA
ncbi:unnamed protein product, partial [Phaeothamnion confervicola]